MNKSLTLAICIWLCTTIVVAQDLPIQETKNALHYTPPLESTLNYSKDFFTNQFDYLLLPIGETSFKLKFVNQPSDYLDISIYDIIGNLILKETVTQAKNAEIEYQMDDIKSKIFIIKVKSGKIGLTKKFNF